MTHQLQRDEALLHKDEVAHLLSTTPSHVETLAERGDLHYYRIGRYIRFTRADVQDYLAQVHVQGTESTYA